MNHNTPRRSLFIAVATLSLAASSLTCTTGVDEFDKIYAPKEYAEEQAEKKRDEERARKAQEEQQQAQQPPAIPDAPQGEFGPPVSVGVPAVHPPVINSITFPSSIPGNHTNIDGEMGFSDGGGDVNRATMTVVHSSGNFAATDWDPSPYLLSGSNYAGSYYFYVWCEGQQSVTLKLTLYDAAGVASAGKDFSFSCT